jgi:hypothetical protein
MVQSEDYPKEVGDIKKIFFAQQAQLRKARGTWARVGQVLQAENVPPRVAAKFYKAIMVQAVLLYGSEMWVLSKAGGRRR